jgi:hypothetical protein
LAVRRLSAGERAGLVVKAMTQEEKLTLVFAYLGAALDQARQMPVAWGRTVMMLTVRLASVGAS